MSYVFFDLEWNQGYPHGEANKLDEIIQIGAYRMDSWEDQGTPFVAYVRPSIHKKLHHRVKKMLPLTQEDLEKANPFRRVIRDFFRWCGDDPVFFTWGSCDARVLDTNLCWYGMEEYLDLEIYDLQRAYDVMIAHTDQQAALRDAVEKLHLEAALEYHDAGNDAYYTALIGAEMVRELGALPTEETLQEMEAALRREKREAALQAAKEALEAAVESYQPVFTRNVGVYKSREDCLKSRSARVYRCPNCETWLCNGNWYQVGDRYISRSRCVEHGRYYACLTIKEHLRSLWTGEVSVYDANDFPAELFYLCKSGGIPIMISKTPKKRRRFHSKKSRTKG